jgi:hypothetical protein
MHVELGMPERLVAVQLGHTDGGTLVRELYGHGDHGALAEIDGYLGSSANVIAFPNATKAVDIQRTKVRERHRDGQRSEGDATARTRQRLGRQWDPDRSGGPVLMPGSQRASASRCDRCAAFCGAARAPSASRLD